MAIDQTRLSELCGNLREVLLESGWDGEAVPLRLGCDEGTADLETYAEIDADLGEELIVNNWTYGVTMKVGLNLAAEDLSAEKVEGILCAMEGLLMNMSYDELNRDEDARFYVCEWKCKGRGGMQTNDKSWVCEFEADLVVQF